MTRAEFVDFVRATFNAMDMITPSEGGEAVIQAFVEYERAHPVADSACCVPPSAAQSVGNATDRSSLPASLGRGLAPEGDAPCMYPVGLTTCGYGRVAAGHFGSTLPAPPAGRHEYSPAKRDAEIAAAFDGAEMADEEMVPHAFNSRTPYEPGDDRDIWCKDCAYHRDHPIHAAPEGERRPPHAPGCPAFRTGEAIQCTCGAARRFTPRKDADGDYVCAHGVAVDVHCCHCHNGFIFDPDHECPLDPEGERRPPQQGDKQCR